MSPLTIVGAGGIGCAVGYALCAAGAAPLFVDADRDKIRWGRQHGVTVDRHLPLPASFVPNQNRNWGQASLNLLSFELDLWGRLRRSTEAARANLLNSEENRKAVVTTLVSDVATNYFSLLQLDYELEIGVLIGHGNALGHPIAIDDAENHVFGLCLVNDWSARDIQAWEYQPLGPFLGKSFATTLSPWVVTMEAIAPFRTGAFARPEGDPVPLPYLSSPDDQKQGGLDLWLEVSLSSVRMRQAGIAPMVLGRSNFRDMYWTMAQMLTHHASNGCNLRTGDLLASGTVSGANKSARGCLLELTSRGKEPVTLQTGEKRKFLEDGDEVILNGYCEREGFRRIGLGNCRGIIAPASERGN